MVHLTFKANKAVTEAVEDAQAALRTKDQEKTKEALDRGMADKSPYGCKTVLEYKHHDIADDEEDEKKIYRAESRAARAVKLSASRTSQHQLPAEISSRCAGQVSSTRGFTIAEPFLSCKPTAFSPEIYFGCLFCVWQSAAI